MVLVVLVVPVVLAVPHRTSSTSRTSATSSTSGTSSTSRASSASSTSRVTTAAQLPSTPGHTFSWQVVFDTATGVLITMPLEVPSSVPRGLYEHMSCTLMASCVGMDGRKYTHMKSLHADDKPDISGVKY